jgi:type III restriction enzyme
VDCLKSLHQAAEALQADTNRYIRPILLVQVERTGKEQRETGFIHAEDAREHLLRLGFHEREIAIKTAEVNNLKAPENVDLLSSTCPVRVIITKQALQEGWDCSFAYVLCTLSASRNLNAMTQLIGRILRQSEATKTSMAALDECYVFCHHARTKEIIDKIKQGLEKEGMGDLAVQIRESEGDSETKTRKIARRDVFRNTEIFLPVVLWVEGETVRPLDYEQDILFGLDWDAININALGDSLSPGAIAHGTQVTRMRYSTSGELESEEAIPVMERAVFDPVYATRVITDIVPNPWIARRFIEKLLQQLRGKGFSDDKLGELSPYVLEELRKHLLRERDRIAESKFMAEVVAERIQFRLRTDRHNWRLPPDIDTDFLEKPEQLIRDDGRPVEKNLFSPVYREDFNNDEAEFACYIDEERALKWWHRNVARNGHYFVQGWRKHKVYPDFIFALRREGGKERLVVLETKGDQLEGNLDTAYKRKLLEELTKASRREKIIKVGELQIVCEGKEIVCDLVLMSEWKEVFHTRIANAPSSKSQGQFTPGEMAAA